jgi:ring-1,2-phenylacetyl-CoA epoxidase subunit PaaC
MTDARRQTTDLDAARFAYVLRHADDCLILSQRLGDLISRAPELEEDIAMANIALDILGTGRRLLQYAGEIEGEGRTEDDLAFGRSEREFTNLLLVEAPNGDFAQTMARQFLFDAYQDLLWNRLVDSDDTTLSGIAGKARKESSYHLRHSRSWILRLGDGTEESHRRMQDGLASVWRFTGEMFIDDDADRTAADAGYGVLPSSLREGWSAEVSHTIAEATLTLPEDPSVRTGGRSGRHSEAMGPLLAEMQHMYRSFPGASW